MNTFFAEQIDYISFFYGLSFILLAGASFTLIRRPSQRHIPYRWFCLFAFTHGLYVWLDLIAIEIGDQHVFYDVRLAFLTISYIFLFEFARHNLSRLYRQPIGRWIYLPLFLATGLGLHYGHDGFNAVARYVLGFLGGIGSAVVFFKNSKTEKSGQNALFWASMAMGCYALATGLVVPRAEFFPANILNHESFFQFFGFPIQLLRALSALVAAIALWFFSGENMKYELKQRQYFIIHSQLFDFSAIALLVIIFGGWILTQQLGLQAKQKIIEDGTAQITLLGQYLEEELSQSKRLVTILSGSSLVWPALVSQSNEDIQKANEVLDRYNAAMGAAVTYLMDAKGTVIASSNRNLPNSFIGKDYAFRPYFMQASQGTPGSYFAIGDTSAERGYYVSHAVKNPEGEILGVVVMKRNMGYVEAQLSGYPYSFVIDPNGIIFLASQPDFVLKSLWLLDQSTEEALLKSQQFGNKPFTPLLSAPVASGQTVDFFQKKFFVNRLPIVDGKWSLVHLQPQDLIARSRLFSQGFVLILCALVIVTVIILRQKEYYMAVVLAAETQRKDMLDAAVQVAIMVTDAEGNLLVFNKGAERMLGYTAEEVIGKQQEDLFHLREEIQGFISQNAGNEESRLLGHKRLVDYVKQGILKARQGTYICKDGKKLWCDVTYSAMHGPEGDFIGLLEVTHDITERRKAEQQLADLLDLNQKILSSSAVGILAYKASGECLVANEAAGRIINAEVPQLLAQNFRQLASWRTGGLLAVADEVLKTGKARREELHFLTTFGKEVWLDGFFTTFKRGEDANLLLLINDVTDSKRISQELLESRNYLSEIINSVADPIFVKDREHRWVLVNNALCNFMGHQSAELLGRSDYDFFPKEQADVFWEKDETVFRTRRENINEEKFTDAAGVVHTIVTKKVLYTNQKGENFIVGLIRDITTHKQAEAALEQAMAIRQEFTSMVSHELRTPLGPIKEGVSIILDGLVGSINDEQRDLLNVVDRNAERLNRLINNVLDFQKLQSDRMTFDIREHDVADVIQEVYRPMVLMTKEKGLDFTLELEPNLPSCDFDRDKIIQVLTNLVHNAIKFTDQGQIKIAASRAGNAVHICVKDTGIGMTPEDLPKLFQSFQQLDSSSGRGQGGTGLGLAISQQIMIGHQGRIWAESEFGKGSAFHFELKTHQGRV